jgi:hypothetical protein
LSSIFSAVFLIRVGLAPVQIFLAFAAILALRFIIRPVVLIATPAMGLRRALVFGSVLCLLSCLVLALVDGVGLALASFIVVSALGQVFYCTCYYVFFSALGDRPQGQPDRTDPRSRQSRALKLSPSAMASASPPLSMLVTRRRPSATRRVRTGSRGPRRLAKSLRPRRSAPLTRCFRLTRRLRRNRSSVVATSSSRVRVVLIIKT